MPKKDASAEYGSETLRFRFDFGEPSPKTCSRCSNEFHRNRNSCPECGHDGYGYSPHPDSEFTPQLVKQLITAGAGYVAVRAEMGADNTAFLWWNEGVEARSRHPGGSWQKFTLGLANVFNDAEILELVHIKECPPSIARQMRGQRGDECEI